MRIGRFCRHSVKKKSKVEIFSVSDSVKITYALGFIVMALLIMSGLETNPGPKNEIAELKEIMNEVKQSNDNIVSELKKLNETMMTLQKRVEILEEENKLAKTEIKDLRCYTDYLESTIDDLENRSRRENLVFFGVVEDENETWNSCENKVRDLIQTRLRITLAPDDLQRVHRAGVKRSGKHRVIVAKFLRAKVKEEVLQKRKLLRGTRIFIEEDFSQKVRQERRQLKQYMDDARQKGHNAYIRYRHLIVDGRKYNLWDLCKSDNVSSENNVATPETQVKNPQLNTFSPNSEDTACNKEDNQRKEEVPPLSQPSPSLPPPAGYRTRSTVNFNWQSMKQGRQTITQ